MTPRARLISNMAQSVPTPDPSPDTPAKKPSWRIKLLQGFIKIWPKVEPYILEWLKSRQKPGAPAAPGKPQGVPGKAPNPRITAPTERPGRR